MEVFLFRLVLCLNPLSQGIYRVLPASSSSSLVIALWD